MARPCKFCGAFFQDSKELELHENLHRDLDYLNENVSDVFFFFFFFFFVVVVFLYTDFCFPIFSTF